MTIVPSQSCIDIFHVIGLKYGACSSSLREKLFINEHEMQDFSKCKQAKTIYNSRTKSKYTVLDRFQHGFILLNVEIMKILKKYE